MGPPTFGKPFRDRSVEELVKHECGLDRDQGRPRRGCGCATVIVALAGALALASGRFVIGSSATIDGGRRM